MIEVINTKHQRTAVIYQCAHILPLFLLIITPAAAQDFTTVEYEIIDLGTLGGGSSVALGINNSSQIVGSADTSEGLRHAYRWDKGEMIDLGTIRGVSQSEAWGINNLGQVAVMSGGSGLGAITFLWDNGTKTEIFPEKASSVFSINDSGQVVGTFTVRGTRSHAFLWKDGVVTDLGSFSVVVERAIAWDINNLGQVVGESPSDSFGGAFLWETGVLMNLGTFSGEGGSEASDINDLGQIVGRAARDVGSNERFAFLWQNGEMIDLSARIGFDFFAVEGINNNQHILVVWFLYNYPNNTYTELIDLISENSGWTALFGRGINDLGQIVGSGTINGARHAFLMTPFGACCNRSPDLNGPCVDDVSIMDCTSPHSVFTTIQTCDEFLCEEVTGACCELLHGTCRDNTLHSECMDSQPVWSVETSCSEVICDPAIGACCNTRFGICTDNLILADCQNEHLQWIKSESCNIQNCPDPFIPTVSQWGLVVFTLLLLIGAKIYFNRQLYLIPK